MLQLHGGWLRAVRGRLPVVVHQQLASCSNSSDNNSNDDDPDSSIAESVVTQKTETVQATGLLARQFA